MKMYELKLEVRTDMVSGYHLKVFLQCKKGRAFYGFGWTNKIYIGKLRGCSERIMSIIRRHGGVQKFMLCSLNRRIEEARELYDSEVALADINNTTMEIELSDDVIRSLKNLNKKEGE